MPDTHIVPDENKFRELILYVAEKSVGDPTFGATKLNKILFFSDFLTYGHLGKPVTGVEYQKLEWGPAPRRLLPIQRELEDDGDAKVVPLSYGYTQKRLVALRTPNLDEFSAPEIAIVDAIIEELRDSNAQAVSELSHNWSLGWMAANDGEMIPYDTVFWTRPDLSSELVQEAGEVALKLGLQSEDRDQG